MNGLLDRIVQRRRATASRRLGPPNGASPTTPTEDVNEPDARSRPAPAQRGAGEAPRRLREHSRIRRRTRYLRRLRELQLRDIGGFVLELHRFGRDRPDLVDVKVQAAAKTDRELRALERALGERRALTEVREPGIGGACSECGTVHGSADRYCSWCGREL